MGLVGVCVCKVGERVKGKSIFMFEIDCCGGVFCVDDLRLEFFVCVFVCVFLFFVLFCVLFLVMFVWYGVCLCVMKLWEVGISVIVNLGFDMEVVGELSGGW